MLSDIISRFCLNVFKTCPVRDGGEGIATHQDVEKVQRNGSLFSWPKILTKAGCPEILQDLMVKKWILDVSESFGQLNTQFNFSKEWISSIDRSRIIQLGDAVWMPILSTENICQEKTYLHTWTSSYLTLINNSIY